VPVLLQLTGADGRPHFSQLPGCHALSRADSVLRLARSAAGPSLPPTARLTLRRGARTLRGSTPLGPAGPDSSPAVVVIDAAVAGGTLSGGGGVQAGRDGETLSADECAALGLPLGSRWGRAPAPAEEVVTAFFAAAAGGGAPLVARLPGQAAGADALRALEARVEELRQQNEQLAQV
jgi:hypothetical protein